MNKIERVSVTDSAVARIKDLIATGKCSVGEKLPTEAALCAALGVSRTSVREAMRVLQAQGFVEIRPGRGAFVADYMEVSRSNAWYAVDGANFGDFMDVRLAIESLAVRLAAERATEAEILELRNIQRSFAEAHYSQEVSRLVILDEQFHTQIAKCAKNQLIANINQELTESFRPFRRTTFSERSSYNNAVTYHADILECIARHDPYRAETVMRQHLSITSQDFHRIQENVSP